MYVKCKDDFPQEAQCLLSVSVHDVSGVDGGAFKIKDTKPNLSHKCSVPWR